MTPSLLRVALAALVGGIVWFAWGAFAHKVLNCGEDSLQRLPNETAVMATLRETTPLDGLYMFPHWDESLPEDAQMTALEKKYQEGPVGMLVYRRAVSEVMPPSMFFKEFFGGLVASAIAAFILSRLSWGVLATARAAGLCAVAMWCTHSFSEWIWWGYPWSWVMDALFEQTVGWILAGGSIAFALRGRSGA